MTNKPSSNRLAIVLMVLAMIALGSNDAIFKLLSGFIPVGQTIAMRGVALCLLLIITLLVAGHGLSWRALTDKWCVIRGLCELVATFLFLYSFTHVALAVATTLVFSSPIILTAVSGPLFGERVGKWRWLAVLSGFVGVLLITWNDGESFNFYLLMPLGAAICVAGRDITTRYIPKEIPAASITLTTATIVLAASLVTLPLTGIVAAELAHYGFALGAAVLVGLSFFCSIKAIRIGELSLLAPVQYIIILWATLLGFTFWNEIPSTKAMIGGAIIIISGLVILWRERVAAARADSQTP